MRILPLLSCSVLGFVGNSLQEENSWAECKSHLLENISHIFCVKGWYEKGLCSIFLRIGSRWASTSREFSTRPDF